MRLYPSYNILNSCRLVLAILLPLLITANVAIQDSSISINASGDVCVNNPAQQCDKLSLPKSRNDSMSGLGDFFDMLNLFLYVVQPRTLGEMLIEYNMTSFNDFTEEYFVNDWTSWILYYIGFGICILAGVIFALVMPFIGCGFCCCRCCGRRRRRKRPSSRCRRVLCGSVLIGLASLMVASCVLALLTNELVATETTPQGTLGDWERTVRTIHSFEYQLVDDINSTVMTNMNASIDQGLAILYKLPNDSLAAINNLTNLDSLMAELQYVADGLRPLRDNLTTMNNAVLSLNPLVEELDVQLNSSKASIELLMQACIITLECTQALELLPLLTSDARYYHLYNVTNAISVLDMSLSAGIESDLQMSISTYVNVTEKVQDDLTKQVDGIAHDIRLVQSNASTEFERIAITLTSYNFSSVYSFLDEGMCYLNMYAPYYTLSIILLTSLLLLISSLIYLGIACGCLCPSPSKYSSKYCSSTSHLGANLLMTTVFLTLIFCWVFMALTTVAFTGGGGIHNNLCRHLVDYEDDSTLDKLGEMAFNDLHITFNISIQNALKDCQLNSSFYTASNAEHNGFNITEILDLNQTGIYEKAAELKNLTFGLSAVIVMENSTSDALMEVSSQIESINFTEYKVELSKNTTKIDIDEYAALLDAASIAVRLNNNTLADNITNEAQLLRIISATTGSLIETNRLILNSSSREAETAVERMRLSQLVIDLGTAQSKLNDQGDFALSALVVSYSDEVIKILETFTKVADQSVRMSVGNCRAIYESVYESIYAPCVYFLYAFNSLWFCYGWYLFCSVPAMIFATKMAAFYRSGEASANAVHDDLDSVSEENLPMADYDKPPPPYQEVAHGGKKF